MIIRHLLLGLPDRFADTDLRVERLREFIHGIGVALGDSLTESSHIGVDFTEEIVVLGNLEELEPQ